MSKKPKAAGSKRLTTISHPDGKCGNVGCTKCFGINFNPFLEGKTPVGMPPWMFQAWKEQNDVHQK